MHRFLVTSFLASLFLTLGELDNTSLEQLADQDITLRGFLISNEKNEWFLAKQPNIKSCCIGKKQTIKLVGGFPAALKNQVIQIQGILRIENETYLLENPSLVKP